MNFDLFPLTGCCPICEEKERAFLSGEKSTINEFCEKWWEDEEKTYEENHENLWFS